MNENIYSTALKLVEKSKISLIGSISNEGYPNMKAMLAPREILGLTEIYFSTNTSSLRVQQFIANPKTSLYFYDENMFEGLLLEGEMEVITNQEIKDRIWREGDILYYKNGKTDSDYCVLCFKAKKGRFYSNFSSTDFVISK